MCGTNVMLTAVSWSDCLGDVYLNNVMSLITLYFAWFVFYIFMLFNQDKSALCVAASEGHLEVAKLLIDNGANVNYRCKVY